MTIFRKINTDVNLSVIRLVGPSASYATWSLLWTMRNDKTDLVETTTKKLSELLNMSRESIKNYLKKLRQVGLIESAWNGVQHIIKVNLPTDVKDSFTKKNLPKGVKSCTPKSYQGGYESTGGVGRILPGGGVKSYPPSEGYSLYIKKENKENKERAVFFKRLEKDAATPEEVVQLLSDDIDLVNEKVRCVVKDNGLVVTNIKELCEEVVWFVENHSLRADESLKTNKDVVMKRMNIALKMIREESWRTPSKSHVADRHKEREESLKSKPFQMSAEADAGLKKLFSMLGIRRPGSSNAKEPLQANESSNKKVKHDHPPKPINHDEPTIKRDVVNDSELLTNSVDNSVDKDLNVSVNSVLET